MVIGLTQIKLEKKIMIGIFLTREEGVRLIECLIFEKSIKNKKDVVADFVCPTEKTRKMFKADLVIWMDTIKKEDLKIPIKCSRNQNNMILE